MDLGKQDELPALVGSLAEMLVQPDTDILDTLPKNLGEAAEVYIKVARLRMSKDRFRGVPSKRRRFVSFVGEDTDIEDVGAKLEEWRTWVEKESGLAASTARVQLNRAGEFVRWLKQAVLSV